MERSKFVCIMNRLPKLQDFLNKTDVIESCSKESTQMQVLQVNCFNSICCVIQRRTYGLNDAVLTESLLRNCTINCLAYRENKRHLSRDNLYPFCVLLLMKINNRNKISKNFSLLIQILDGLSPNQF